MTEFDLVKSYVKHYVQDNGSYFQTLIDQKEKEMLINNI